jgi:hypothetical protein
MNGPDHLTEPEASYVRRYCWEVATDYNHFGPGSIFDYCRGHCRDLEVLATVSAIQYDVLEMIVDGAEPPASVPFPWDSFEALHARTQEFASATNPC